MKVILQDVRIAFPDLFEAVPFEAGGAPRYSATFIVEPGSENHKKVLEAIEQVASAAWGAKAKSMLASFANNSAKTCYTSGDTKSWSGADGKMVLTSHRRASDKRPTVVGRKLEPLTAEDGVIYSGCRVNASVDIWAQKNQYPGIRCTLLGVQFVADDEAFSGAPRPTADDFSELEDLF